VWLAVLPVLAPPAVWLAVWPVPAPLAVRLAVWPVPAPARPGRLRLGRRTVPWGHLWK